MAGDDAGPGLAGGEERWRFESTDPFNATPTVDGDTVYVGSADTHAYALDANDGTPRWSFPTGGSVEASPAVDGNTVYVGSDDGNCYAVDAADGTERWRLETAGKVRASPVVADDTVHVGSESGAVYALDAETGDERWRFDTEMDVQVAPAVDDGGVYVGAWHYDVDSGAARGAVYAIDAGDGTERWQFGVDDMVTTAPTVVDGRVHVGTSEDGVYALDSEDGTVVWCNSMEYAKDVLSVTDGTVYVGSGDGAVHVLDADTGEERWRYRSASQINATTAPVEGMVYLECPEGLYAVDVERGVERWRFPVEEPLGAGSTVAGGTVYVPGFDGNVYALATTGAAADRPDPFDDVAAHLDEQAAALDAVAADVDAGDPVDLEERLDEVDRALNPVVPRVEQDDPDHERLAGLRDRVDDLRGQVAERRERHETAEAVREGLAEQRELVAILRNLADSGKMAAIEIEDAGREARNLAERAEEAGLEELQAEAASLYAYCTDGTPLERARRQDAIEDLDGRLDDVVGRLAAVEDGLGDADTADLHDRLDDVAAERTAVHERAAALAADDVSSRDRGPDADDVVERAAALEARVASLRESVDAAADLRPAVDAAAEALEVADDAVESDPGTAVEQYEAVAEDLAALGDDAEAEGLAALADRVETLRERATDGLAAARERRDEAAGETEPDGTETDAEPATVEGPTTTVDLPDVGPVSTEGTVEAWFVAVGDAVEADQPLATVETEMAEVEVPSPFEGTVAERLAEEGETVQAGEPLVAIQRDEDRRDEEPTATKPPEEDESDADEETETTGGTGADEEAEEAQETDKEAEEDPTDAEEEEPDEDAEPASGGDEPGPPEDVPAEPRLDLDHEMFSGETLEGQGGNADVFREAVTVRGDEHVVAVKKPRVHGTLTGETMERFQREAETWAKLDDHGHVVGVVDWGDAPLPWIAMEYMDGGDLSQRAGALPLAQATWTAAAIADAVVHAHERGVLHRDLKPENVLFRSVEGAWDVPKVADWGLAKLLLDDSHTVEGFSPRYAAPEQLDDERGSTGHATDVYQLGAVLYELFTGEPAFEGPTTQVVTSVLTASPTPPTEVAPELPPALDDLLLTALAKEPADRQAHAIYLRDALQELYGEL